VMQACYKAAFELYDETAAKNENFRKVYEPWKLTHPLISRRPGRA